MIEWLLINNEAGQAAQADTLRRLLGRAWRGSARAALLRVTEKARPVLVLSPEGATALREPRWPDVLSDWSDIYEERLFPSPLLPVAGEVLSEQGAECLALHADLGAPSGPRGGIAWYEKGALVELEQVGQAAVAWRPGQPLSRPAAGGARSQLAGLGRAMAKTQAEQGLYERVESGLAATTEQVLERALLRLLGTDPPPLNELAAAVLRAPTGLRLAL